MTPTDWKRETNQLHDVRKLTINSVKRIIRITSSVLDDFYKMRVIQRQEYAKIGQQVEGAVNIICNCFCKRLRIILLKILKQTIEQFDLFS